VLKSCLLRTMLVPPETQMKGLRAIPSMLFDMEADSAVQDEIDSKSSQCALRRTRALVQDASDSVSKVCRVTLRWHGASASVLDMLPTCLEVVAPLQQQAAPKRPSMLPCTPSSSSPATGGRTDWAHPPLLPPFVGQWQVSDVLGLLTQQDDLVAAAQALGYSVRLRDCVGGGQGAACLHNLRHSFLILSPSPHSSCSVPLCEEIIIDPTFREQFIIAHPSPRYSAVLDALPPVFIGTPSKVQPLVEFLCSEMVTAFNAAGIVVPPWRSLRSMMTKWLPRRSLDLQLQPHTSSTPAAAAAAAAQRVTGLDRTAVGTAAMLPAIPASSRAPINTTQLLRRACFNLDTQSSVGLSSTTTALHSASSSNCSSSSGAQHPAVLHAAAASVGFDSASSSPAAVPAAPGCPTGPMAVAHVLSNHRGAHAAPPQAAGKGRVPCPAAAKQGVVCFEPLQRVVGGFGFGNTPV